MGSVTAVKKVLGGAIALALALLGLAAWIVLAARDTALVTLGGVAVVTIAALWLGARLDRAYRKRAEADAGEATGRFQQDNTSLEALLNALPDGIVLVDGEGRMRLWNDQLFR